MENKVTRTGSGVDGRRFQRLGGRRPASPMRLARAFEKFRRRHPFKLGFVNVLLVAVVALVMSNCANHDDSDENHSRHHGHGRNGGTGAGQQGTRDSLGLSPSATPVPGM